MTSESTPYVENRLRFSLRQMLLLTAAMAGVFLAVTWTIPPLKWVTGLSLTGVVLLVWGTQTKAVGGMRGSVALALLSFVFLHLPSLPVAVAVLAAAAALGGTLHAVLLRDRLSRWCAGAALLLLILACVSIPAIEL